MNFPWSNSRRLASFIVMVLLIVSCQEKHQAIVSEPSSSLAGNLEFTRTNPLRIQLEQISFANVNEGWGISTGNIVRTTDGGETWSIQQSATNSKSDFEYLPIENRFSKVLALSARVAVAIGSEGVIRSEDGGVTWTRSVLKDVVVRDIYFLNLEKGWLVGNKRPNNQVAWTAALYHSNDGGISWVETNVNQAEGDKTGTWLSVFAKKDQGIWVVGDKLLRSFNGGIEWEKEEICDGVFGLPLELEFFDSWSGVIRTNQGDSFCVTSDGASTWTTRKFPKVNGGIRGLVQTDKRKLWVYGKNGAFQSKDFGRSWTKELEWDFMAGQYLSEFNVLKLVGTRIFSITLD